MENFAGTVGALIDRGIQDHGTFDFGQQFQTISKGVFEDIGQELVVNGVNASIGAVNQLIMAEIFGSAGADNVGDSIVQALASASINSVLTYGAQQLFNSQFLKDLFINIGFSDEQIGSIIGSFGSGRAIFSGTEGITNAIGFDPVSLVINLIIQKTLPPIETLEGNVASAITGALLSAWSVIQNTFNAGGPITIVVSFLVGKIFDKIFEKHPQAWTKVGFNEETGLFELTGTWTDDGGNAQLSQDLAQAYVDAINGFVQEVKSQSNNFDELGQWSFGHYESALKNAGIRGKTFGEFQDAYLHAYVEDLTRAQVNDGQMVAVKAIEDLNVAQLRIDHRLKLLIQALDAVDVLTAVDVQTVRVWGGEGGNYKTTRTPIFAENLREKIEYLATDGGSVTLVPASGQGEGRVPAIVVNVLDTVHTVYVSGGEGEGGTAWRVIRARPDIDLQFALEQLTQSQSLRDLLANYDFETYDELLALGGFTESTFDDEAIHTKVASTLQIASDYHKYMENKDEIDLLITLSPSSALAAGWLQTIQYAEMMGLTGSYDETGDAIGNNFFTAEGDDVVRGAGGDDDIRTYSGDDTIYGGTGNDSLNAGSGDNIVYGNSGDDTFVVNSNGATSTTIVERANEGHDLILFDARFGSVDIQFDEDANGFVASWGHSTIKAQGVEAIAYRFLPDNDGNEQIIEIALDDIKQGDGSEHSLSGSNRSDYLEHGALPEGNQATKYYYGSGGDDLYIYRKDMGNLTLLGETAASGNADRLILRDLNQDDVTLSLRNIDGQDNLQIDWADETGNGTVVIDGFGDHIEAIQFADGSTLSSIDPASFRRLPVSETSRNPERVALYTNDTREQLNGTSGDDVIRAPDLGDMVYIFGGSGNDTLIGSETGQDDLRGDAGNDVLKVGGNIHGGSQMIYGGSGDDTFHIQANSGSVRMTYSGEVANGGFDRIVFDDIALNDLTSITSHNAGADNPYGIIVYLNWEVNGVTGQLSLSNNAQHIEAFEFADGTVLSRIDADWLKYHPSYGASSDSVQSAKYANDTRERIYGTGESDTLNVGSLNYVYAMGGDDVITFSGQSSFQYIYGHGGNDTYRYSAPMNGSLVYLSSSAETATSGEADRFVFTDLNLEDFTFTTYDYTQGGTVNSAEGVSLRMLWSKDGASGEVRLANMGEQIEAFEFADGTVLSRIDADWLKYHPSYGASSDSVQSARFASDTRDKIYATGESDTLNVGSLNYVYAMGGDDVITFSGDTSFQYIYGHGGNDTYRYSAPMNGSLVYLSSSAETATSGEADRFVFTDLNLEDFTFTTYDYTQGGTVNSAEGVSLRMLWSKDGASGEVRLANMGEQIEEFEFADGSVLSRIEPDWFRRHPSYGASSDPDRAELYASDDRDRLDGTSGDDVIRAPDLGDMVYIFGGSGNDTLIGSETGQDDLRGDAGNDVLKVGGNIHGGSQMIYGGSGDDTFHIQANSGSVRMTYSGEVANGGFDRIVFDDIALNDLTSITSHNAGADNPYGIIVYLNWEVNGVTGQLSLSNNAQHIEAFEFADGTVLSRIDADWLKYHPSYGASSDSVQSAKYANDTRERIYGTGESDTLNVGSLNYVYAGAGDDVITFSGQSSFQYIYGHGGNDTYRYSAPMNGSLVYLSSSAETATSGEADRFVFTDLNLEDFTFTTYDYTQGGTVNSAEGVSLRMLWSKDGASGEVRLANMGEQIEAFEFADGTVLSRIDADWLKYHPSYGASSDSVQSARFASDTRDKIYATGESDTLNVGSLNYVYAMGGDDVITFSGDTSFQYIYGHGGNDTYRYSAPMNGSLVYLSSSAETATSGEADRFVFTDLNLEDFTFTTYDYTQGGTVNSAEGVSLRMLWSKDGASGEVRLANMGGQIEEFEFADGTVLSRIDADWLKYHPSYGASSDSVQSARHASDTRDRIYATEEADTLNVGALNFVFAMGGDDVITFSGDTSFQYIYGHGGNDTYRYSAPMNGSLVYLSSSAETATSGEADRFVFTDLNLEDFTFTTYDYTQGGTVNSAEGVSLRMLWSKDGASGEVRLANMGEQIEEFEFADGTVLDHDDFVFV
ncbi:calcium binding hemolysin protein, putative [Roseovarius nubinhibens ISM]|uniref:Calcium binding hemolysin protein, putative n=2 Tax=Roseovarius nubinhibens TaxID=314263 RepID=A3SLP6_ROSNI|nr:calcium binding hemolysin protein, putative [Roseovarius nubinhibens ISM]